jgi:hypothetical protein
VYTPGGRLQDGDLPQVGGSKMETVYKRLKNASVDFECPPWSDFPLAKDLCARLLDLY